MGFQEPFYAFAQGEKVENSDEKNPIRVNWGLEKLGIEKFPLLNP